MRYKRKVHGEMLDDDRIRHLSSYTFEFLRQRAAAYKHMYERAAKVVSETGCKAKAAEQARTLASRGGELVRYRRLTDCWISQTSSQPGVLQCNFVLNRLKVVCHRQKPNSTKDEIVAAQQVRPWVQMTLPIGYDIGAIWNWDLWQAEERRLGFPHDHINAGNGHPCWGTTNDPKTNQRWSTWEVLRATLLRYEVQEFIELVTGYLGTRTAGNTAFVQAAVKKEVLPKRVWGSGVTT